MLAGPAARPAHLVLVSLSGLGPERYRGDGAGAPSMPALAALARAGVAADAVEGVTPASVYPAHATLVTGELPAAHGITADHVLGPQGVRAARFTHATSLRKPTLWQRATEAGLPVAALAWPTTVGAEIAMRLPDLEPARGGDTWLGVLADAATPALLTLARAAGGEAPAANAPGPARDAVLVGVACSLLESPQPPALAAAAPLADASCRCSSTDRARPRRTPPSRSADAELARLFGCLRRGPARDTAALLVTGDHGFAPIHSVLAPNAALARAGLLTPVPGRRRRASRAGRRSRAATAAAPSSTRKQERDAVLARSALVREAARLGAFRVVAADELLRGGADPDAWFGLEAEPGFVFDDTAQAAGAGAGRAARRRGLSAVAQRDGYGLRRVGARPAHARAHPAHAAGRRRADRREAARSRARRDQRAGRWSARWISRGTELPALRLAIGRLAKPERRHDHDRAQSARAPPLRSLPRAGRERRAGRRLGRARSRCCCSPI